MQSLTQFTPASAALQRHRWVRLTQPLLALGLLPCLTLTALSALADDKIVPTTVSWGLTKTVVLDPGETRYLEEGTLTEGYTVEAKAKSKDGKLVPEGTFRLELSAFWPTQADLPGQPQGYWYVQGTWKVIDKYALDDEKHTRGVVSGAIHTALTFNPTLTRENWTALAWVPHVNDHAGIDHRNPVGPWPRIAHAGQSV